MVDQPIGDLICVCGQYLSLCRRQCMKNNLFDSSREIIIPITYDQKLDIAIKALEEISNLLFDPDRDELMCVNLAGHIAEDALKEIKNV